MTLYSYHSHYGLSGEKPCPVGCEMRKRDTQPPVERPTYKFCGMPVTVQFSRRPRVLRLEVKKARP